MPGGDARLHPVAVAKLVAGRRHLVRAFRGGPRATLTGRPCCFRGGK
jgi:hypothetical protein